MIRNPWAGCGPKPARALTALAGAVIVAALALVPPAAAATSTAASCTAAAFPVSAADAAATMTGQLCSRGSPAGKALIVTMPGATYSDVYWDFPGFPADNFTLAATLAGYAVLNLNELGTPPGRNYPPPADVTVPSNAEALHQVIGEMSEAYPRELLAGHSFGAIIVAYENATWHDPSVLGLLLQGFRHAQYAPGVERAEASLYPAQDDPAFAGDGLPPGYLTTMPGTRLADFGAAGDESAVVAAADEGTKAVTTGAELAGMSLVTATLTQAISVPVDVVDGQYDNLLCGPVACPTSAAVYAGEAPDFSPAGHLTVFVLAAAGHSVNLAKNAFLATAQELAWAVAVGH